MKRLVNGILGLVILMSTVYVFAASPWAGDFSADMVSTSQGQKFQAKLTVSKDKSRMETSEMIVISRMDKNVAWMIMPSQGMYMEQPIDYKTVAQTGGMTDEISRKPLGTETVDGKPAQKFEVAYSAAGRQESVYQWMQGDMPVRVAAIDGSWTVEYKNFNKGAVSADLFEVPQGYQKFVVPSIKDLTRTAGAEAQESLIN